MRYLGPEEIREYMSIDYRKLRADRIHTSEIQNRSLHSK